MPAMVTSSLGSRTEKDGCQDFEKIGCKEVSCQHFEKVGCQKSYLPRGPKSWLLPEVLRKCRSLMHWCPLFLLRQMHLGFFFFWSFDLWRIFPDQLLISDASNKTITWLAISWQYSWLFCKYFTLLSQFCNNNSTKIQIFLSNQAHYSCKGCLMILHPRIGTESGKKN